MSSGEAALARCVRERLASVHLAPRQARKALTLWPLIEAEPSRRREVLGLSRALEDGCISVRAVPKAEAPRGGAAGTVSVSVANRGPDPVLIAFGEELPGAAPVLLASASELVEPGGEVVLACHRRPPGVPSPERRRFHLLHDQVGFVAAAGDVVLGVELVASSRLLAHVLPVLVARHAAEALRLEAALEPPGFPGAIESPEALLEDLIGARFFRATGELVPLSEEPETAPLADVAVGPSDLRLLGRRSAGCALVADQLIHLTAFPEALGGEEP